MSGCPSVKCRNVGSGYVKPSASGSSAVAAECSKKMDEMLAARAMQDNTYFPAIPAATAIPAIHSPSVAHAQVKPSQPNKK